MSIFKVCDMIYQVSPAIPLASEQSRDGLDSRKSGPIPTEELLAKHQRNVDELFAAWRKRNVTE